VVGIQDQPVLVVDLPHNSWLCGRTVKEEINAGLGRRAVTVPRKGAALREPLDRVLVQKATNSLAKRRVAGGSLAWDAVQQGILHRVGVQR
jgi:hypothetical protein